MAGGVRKPASKSAIADYNTLSRLCEICNNIGCQYIVKYITMLAGDMSTSETFVH